MSGLWRPKSLSSWERDNPEQWTAELAQLAVQEGYTLSYLQRYVWQSVKLSGYSQSAASDAVNSYNRFYGIFKRDPSTMPVPLKAFGRKGKPKNKPLGIGKTARNNKTYGGLTINDWDSALAQAVNSNVAKQIGKTIETQYSQTQITMNEFTSVPGSVAAYNSAVSSWALCGLNQNFTPIIAPVGSTNAGQTTGYNFATVYHQVMWFNLSTLSQIRGPNSAGVAGYRQGYKISPSYVKARLTGWVNEMGADCQYHVMIAKRKDGAGAGFIQAPTLQTSDAMNLYKPITDGPCAALSAGTSPAVPDSHFISKMRRNQDAWSFPEGCHKKIVLTQNESAELPGVTNTTSQATNVDVELFKSLSGTWDFTSQNYADKPVLKGGDYYVFVWREGAVDPSMEQYLTLYLELAFKDA